MSTLLFHADRWLRVAAAVAGGLIVSGCHADAVTPASGPDKTAAYQSPGKRQAPLALSWRLRDAAVVGQPINIDLGIVPATRAGRIELSIEAGRGLAGSKGIGTVTLDDMEAGEVASHSVTVTPLVDGQHFVNIIAVMQTEAGPQMKTFAIPVSVGDMAAAKTTPQIDADGNQVVILPAEEREGD